MYQTLKKINARPSPFEKYTAEALWTDPHTSSQVLSYYLNAGIDLSSRKHAFIDFKYDDVKVVLDKYTIIEADRTREVYNWLQHFDTETLQSEFRVAGFDREALFGDVAGSPFSPEGQAFVIVARKPQAS